MRKSIASQIYEAMFTFRTIPGGTIPGLEQDRNGYELDIAGSRVFLTEFAGAVYLFDATNNRVYIKDYQSSVVAGSIIQDIVDSISETSTVSNITRLYNFD